MAERWWKNGDHPQDHSEELDDGTLSEGKVVGHYTNRGTRKGTDLCPDCGAAYEIHGWIADPATDDRLVHPGDWIINGKNGYYTRRDDPMEQAVKDSK